MPVAEKLKQIRKSYQMTQEDFAKELYVTRQTISNWETGKSQPDIETLMLVCRTFQMSFDDLLRLEDAKRFDELDKHDQENVVKHALTMIISVIMLFILIGTVKFYGMISVILGMFFICLLTISCEQLENMKKKNKISSYKQILKYLDKGVGKANA